MAKDNKTYQACKMLIDVPAEFNQLLTESSKKSGRSKRQEASLRLFDHLIRVDSIASIDINAIQKK